MFEEQGGVCSVVRTLRRARRGFDYNYHNRVERCAGVYAFWLNGGCLYVGMSIDLHQRMYTHRMQEHNSQLSAYFRAFSQHIQASCVTLQGRSSAELRSLEHRLISVLRPLANITGSN